MGKIAIVTGIGLVLALLSTSALHAFTIYSVSPERRNAKTKPTPAARNARPAPPVRVRVNVPRVAYPSVVIRRYNPYTYPYVNRYAPAGVGRIRRNTYKPKPPRPGLTPSERRKQAQKARREQHLRQMNHRHNAFPNRR